MVGTSAVEFGFIAPVLLVLVLGSIEFGLITFTFISAETAARDVTRRLSLNQITASQAPAIASGELPSWVSSSATITVTQSAPTDPPNNQFTVSIAIPATKATPTNVLSWAYGTLTLKAAVTMQQEPSS